MFPFQAKTNNGRKASSATGASGLNVEHAAKPAPLRLTLAEQWARLSGVLAKSIGMAHHARQLQSSAAQQIDLATYAFQGIVDELAAVMTLPARREPAVVHLFEPAAQRPNIHSSLAA